MMYRKMMDTLQEWKAYPNKMGLTIVGPRQIGKTFVVDWFGKENYENYLRMDFTRSEDFRIFRNSIEAADIYRKLALYHPEFTIEKGKSLLFLDEIQFCPDARAAIKPLVSDGDVDVIASGSLLGTSGLTSPGKTPSRGSGSDHKYIERAVITENRESRFVIKSEDPDRLIARRLEKGNRRLNPMGYEIIKRMHAMDFEEYLWAMGVSRDLTDEFRRNIERREPFDPDDLEVINRYFRQFIVVGGMPKAVEVSLSKNGALRDVKDVQHSLNMNMTETILKYAPSVLRLKCRECIDSVPRHLGRENKRFMFNDIRGDGNKVGMREYADPIAWIASAGFVSMCPNLTEPVRPLTPRSGSMFKLYMYDTGLLLDMMGDGARAAVFDGDLTANNGAVMENAVASMIDRSGFDLFYFERNRVDKDGRKDRIEIDFVTDLGGELAAIEVKSGTNRGSRSLSKLVTDPRYRIYDIHRRIKLENSNVFTDELGVEHYPLFAAAFMDSMVRRPEIELVSGLDIGFARRRREAGETPAMKNEV